MPKFRISATDLNGIIRQLREGKRINSGNIRDYIYRPGVYGFSGQDPRLGQAAQNAKIDRQIYQAIERGVHPAARQKLVNLIKKVRKKTGKTYYQRMQIAKLQAIANSAPLTAKRYVKGADFGFAHR